MNLVNTARLLAMGELTVTDAAIACFDSKYHFLLWRPLTAIRNAELDGNAATEPDTTGHRYSTRPITRVPVRARLRQQCARGGPCQGAPFEKHQRGHSGRDGRRLDPRDVTSLRDGRGSHNEIVNARVWIGSTIAIRRSTV